MKQFLRYGFGLMLLLSISMPAQAQFFGMPAIINPAAPLECNPFAVSFDWTLGCINYTINGYTQSIVADTIFIDISISGGPICLGALSFHQHTENFSNVPVGAYTLKLRSYTNGTQNPQTQTQPLNVGSCCAAVASFTVSSPSLNVCLGDSLTFDAVNQTQSIYNWSLNGSSLTNGLQAGATFSQVGTYTVALETGDTTCTSTTTQVIVVNQPSASVTSSTDESCPGDMNGAIDLMVTGGFSPYTYSWSNGTTSQDPSQLSAGTYSVLVTDNEGCTANRTVTLSVGVPVTTAFSNTATDICAGGSVSFTDMSTGATNYTWYQDGIVVNQTANPMLSFANSGTYDIQLISSSATCDDTANVQVNVFDPPTLTAMSTDETCPNSQDASIDLMLSGGTSPYTYSWSNGDTTQDLSSITMGSYTVNVTDSLGCQSSQMFTVNIGAGITAGFTYSDSTAICVGESIDFTNTSSSANLIAWSNNGQAFSSMANPTQLFDSAGTYIVQLMIDDGVCTDSTEVSFTVTAAPNVGNLLSDPVCPGDMNGMIDITLTDGVMPFSYTWSNGETTEDISGLDSGQYSVQITDGVGCVVEDTFNLNLLGGLTAGFTITTGGAYVQLDDLTDSTAVSWAWDFGDGNTSTDQNPLHQYAFFGNYNVCLVATDAFGCADSICEEVTISTAIEKNLLFPLEIFPNPTASKVQLRLPASLNGMLDLRIYDVQGKIVLQTERSAQPEITLNLQNLASGLYTILLTDGESYFQGKVVKE